MATKKCANGHLYDPAIYGDTCPFCPSAGSTKVVDTPTDEPHGTHVLGQTGGGATVNINGGGTNSYNPTINLCIAICKAVGKTLDELFWE